MAKNELQKINNFVIFKTDEGKINIDVFFENDTLWLTQKVIAELFGTTKQNISLHLQNIFKENELEQKATIKDFLTVQKEGDRDVSRKVEFYNLDAIIAVGYRVNSERATKFRIWATKILQEFIIKGFSMDDERLKQMKHFGKDYFIGFLELSKYPILTHKGKISTEKARIKAEGEYEKYRIKQDKNYISDFDEEVKKFLKSKSYLPKGKK